MRVISAHVPYLFPSFWLEGLLAKRSLVLGLLNPLLFRWSVHLLQKHAFQSGAIMIGAFLLSTTVVMRGWYMVFPTPSGTASSSPSCSSSSTCLFMPLNFCCFCTGSSLALACNISLSNSLLISSNCPGQRLSVDTVTNQVLASCFGLCCLLLHFLSSFVHFFVLLDMPKVTSIS